MESTLFREQLIELGLCAGDVVMVHSSMKALGTKRTPEEIIEDIKAVIGTEGTLLMPALTYDNVNAEQPVFDSKLTQPCIGLLPTVFCNMPDVVRSVHPTHSVCAWGKYAVEMTKNHQKDETPVGKNSPFMLLPQYHGKILMIGDILEACTFMHGVEEIANSPYTLTKERIHYIVDGQERDMFGHDFYGWGAEYGRIADVLTEPDLRKGQVGQATTWLINPEKLKEVVLTKMKEDPYYFVTDITAWM